MHPAPTIVVQTRALGEALGLSDLPVQGDGPPVAHGSDDRVWLLFRDAMGLALLRDDGVRVAPEFEHGRGAARARESALSSQPIARALGIARLAAREEAVTLVDATAGFGVDAWQAAALGAQVTLLERHPVMHALLVDALARAQASQDVRVSELAHRLTVLRAEACHWLQLHADGPANERASIVYLDPMYPTRRRRARSRKDIETLQQLIPPGDDSRLLDTALDAATARVVVKRPAGAPALENTRGRVPEPVTAPNTRWDRYVATGAGNGR